jgi:hypothetical protein
MGLIDWIKGLFTHKSDELTQQEKDDLIKHSMPDTYDHWTSFEDGLVLGYANVPGRSKAAQRQRRYKLNKRSRR